MAADHIETVQITEAMEIYVQGMSLRRGYSERLSGTTPTGNNNYTPQTMQSTEMTQHELVHALHHIRTEY